MDTNSIRDAIATKLELLGGHASILDDTCIVLSWNHMSGIVMVSEEEGAFIKVSTPWQDSDTRQDVPLEQIPDTVVDLFSNFWARRGVEFRQETKDGR